MKSNLLTHSKKLGAQSFMWRQAVSGSTERGWTLKNILLAPIQKLTYDKRHHPSLLVDKLIVGNNPIIITLLLDQINQECLQKDIKKKVAIFYPNQFDYWAYDIVQHTDFFPLIQKKTALNINSMDSFFTQLLHGISSDHLEIIIIKEDELAIRYCKYDEYAKGWIFHLYQQEQKTIPEINEYIAHQNDIKDTLSHTLFSHLLNKQLAKKIKWIESSNENYPIVLTKDIDVVSLPQGWIQIASEMKDGIVHFQHELSHHSFGSAIKIASDSTTFQSLAKEDITNLKL